MNFVYKITNLINNKVYIGSTTKGMIRFNQHKNTAFNPKSSHYNYPLYQAFRKYGLENFSFEILKDNFSSIEEMQQYEKEMIYYYDSLKHGYNQTDYTECALQDPKLREKIGKKIGTKCALVNEKQEILQIFDSYHDANQKLNFSHDYSSKIRLVCMGEQSSCNGYIFRHLDEHNQIIKLPIKSYKGRKAIIAFDPSILHSHKYYDSILQASNELNINRQSIQQCLNGNLRYWLVGGYIFRLLDEDGDIIENTYLLEDALKEYNRLHPIINNEQHNITDWCKIYNISKTSYYKRIKKGMTPIQAITEKKKG